MKKCILGFIVALISISSFAQEKREKKFHVSIGPELALPVGDFTNLASTGFGGSALAEYKPGEKFGITLGFGIVNYADKNISSQYGNYKYSTEQIFALGGVRYYFTKKIYGSGQFGYSIFVTNGDGSGAFIYAPGVGVRMGLLDATLKYMGATEGSEADNISLRVAISL